MRAVRQGPESTQFLLHSWQRHYTYGNWYRESGVSLSNSVGLLLTSIPCLGPQPPVLDIFNHFPTKRAVNICFKLYRLKIFLTSSSRNREPNFPIFYCKHNCYPPWWWCHRQMEAIWEVFCPRANYWWNSQNIFIGNLNIHQWNDRNIFNQVYNTTYVRGCAAQT